MIFDITKKVGVFIEDKSRAAYKAVRRAGQQDGAAFQKKDVDSDFRQSAGDADVFGYGGFFAKFQDGASDVALLYSDMFIGFVSGNTGRFSADDEIIAEGLDVKKAIGRIRRNNRQSGIYKRSFNVENTEEFLVIVRAVVGDEIFAAEAFYL